MWALAILFFAALALIAGILCYPRWRDRRILAHAFPSAWEEILRRRLPFIPRLGAEEQRQLRQMIQLFMARKHFYGCGGLELTDDMRITIAAQACLLLLNRRTRLYPGLRHILVYPEAYLARHAELHEDGTVSEDSVGLLGESWGEGGKVVLSWDDVEYDTEDFSDGHNVVLHEFSHQLDSEAGITSGDTPVLPHNDYQSWARVLSREYEALINAMEHEHHTVLDHYGATNPAEFFAVVTETFFEKPLELAARHPQLFEEFRKFYRTDPRRWR